MNIDTLVRESIEQGADSLPKREPQPAWVRARSRRSAGIRIALPAFVAAGLIAAVGVVVVDRIGSDVPTLGTADESATYLTDGNRVHIDGHTYRAKHTGEEGVGRSVLTSAGFIYIGSEGYANLIDRSGVERRIGDAGAEGGYTDGATSIADSPDRCYAAWGPLEAGRGLSVSLFDAAASRVVARRTLDCDDLTSGARCRYVTAVSEGSVYVEAEAQADGEHFTVAWDPSLSESGQTYRVTDPGTEVTAAAAKTYLVDGIGRSMPRTGNPLVTNGRLSRSRQTG